MALVYAATERNWFEAILRFKPQLIAFWQPSPARPSKIALGERWYFKALGKPEILGFGEYAGWEKSTISDLFSRYAQGTGYLSEADLLEALQEFNEDLNLSSTIGNVILENVTEFNPKVSLDSVGLSNLSTPFVYINENDPIARFVGGYRERAPVSEFLLRDTAKARLALAKRKVRVGQGAFRSLLVDTYGSVCAFTGPQLSQTLQAAHIQPYVDAESNHVCNGLLLRADMHALFDLGFLTLTSDLRVEVTEEIEGKAPDIEALHGNKAFLTNPSAVEPSPSAIDFHRRDIFLRKRK